MSDSSDREDFEKSNSDTTSANKRIYNERDNYDREYPKREDNDRTPTNEKNNDEGDVTPKSTDIEDMQNTLRNIKQALSGGSISKESLEDIKQEYSSYFDEDSENNTKEALEEIKDYLEGELSASLKKGAFNNMTNALDNIDEVSETRSEASTSTSVKQSEELSPLDYVLEKQSTDPIDSTDDLD